MRVVGCRVVDGDDSPRRAELGHDTDAESSGWARPRDDAEPADPDPHHDPADARDETAESNEWARPGDDATPPDPDPHHDPADAQPAGIAESNEWARPGDAARPDPDPHHDSADAQPGGTVPSSTEPAKFSSSALFTGRPRVFAAAAGVGVLALSVWWATDRTGNDTLVSSRGEQVAVTPTAFRVCGPFDAARSQCGCDLQPRPATDDCERAGGCAGRMSGLGSDITNRAFVRERGPNRGPSARPGQGHG